MLHRIAPQSAHLKVENGCGLNTRAASWILKVLYILYSLSIGVALLCLPWFDFWENNRLLYVCPQIRPLVANAYFKGAVLGLGIVNIMVGIYEIVHFREIAESRSE